MGILDGKVAIITGAARGIGAACAEEFLKQGASVLVNDLGVTKDGRDPDPRIVNDYVAQLKDQGAGERVAANAADAGSREGAQRLVRQCLDTFGTVDILYNNAGVVYRSPFLEMPDDLWHRVLGAHVKSTLHCTQAVLPTMLAKHDGVILNTSSPGAMWGAYESTHYAAAKGAIHSLTLVLSKELYAKGIRVNTIIPGASTRRADSSPVKEETGWVMTGYARAGETVPARNGPLAAYLCSDEAADTHGRTVGVGGDMISLYQDMMPTRQRFMDGGWTIEGLQKTLHHIVRGPVQFYEGANPPPPPARPGSLLADRLLEGKVAIITGGGRGIGRAAALLFAKLGAKLLINDYGIGYDSLDPNGSYAHEVAAQIREMGGQAVANTASVATRDGAKSIIDDCLKAYGTIDVLYNNAGFATTGPFQDIDEPSWDIVFDSNLTGTYYCTKFALPVMMENGRGRIINTSSPGGLWGPPLYASYGAAKGAITAFTRSLYKEVYEHGVTVNNLVPGANTLRDPKFMNTGQEMAKWVRLDAARPPSAMGGLNTPDRVAPLTAYLVSDECADISGHTLFAAADTISLYSEPIRTDDLTMPGGWTVEGLRRRFRAVVPAGPAGAYIGGDAPDYAAMELAARERALRR